MMYWLDTSYCVLYVQIVLNEIHFFSRFTKFLPKLQTIFTNLIYESALKNEITVSDSFHGYAVPLL